MRWILALLQLVLLICPCAFCYGQTSFSSVTGEGGYAAMRGGVHWDADNGFIFMPYFGYYRTSDKEEDEKYAAGKAGLEVQYELSDNTRFFVNGDYVPRRMGFERFSYQVGARWNLCYRCGWWKNPYLQVSTGQVIYDINQYRSGAVYAGGFHAVSPLAIVEAGSEWGKTLLQLRYEKLIKYSHQPPADIAASWMEIPFMTAIVQGFVSDVAAARLAYRTRWITPYAVYAYYRSVVQGREMGAWGGGVSLSWGKTTISGGVENFESHWDTSHKIYYSIAASREF